MFHRISRTVCRSFPPARRIGGGTSTAPAFCSTVLTVAARLCCRRFLCLLCDAGISRTAGLVRLCREGRWELTLHRDPCFRVVPAPEPGDLRAGRFRHPVGLSAPAYPNFCHRLGFWFSFAFPVTAGAIEAAGKSAACA